MKHAHELPVPPAAARDPNGVEAVRVWIANGDVHFSLSTGLWKDPAAWGLVLVDLARHVARAYEQEREMPAVDAAARIRVAIDAEWDSPTNDPVGGVQDA